MRVVVPHAQGVTARDLHKCRMEEGAVVQQLPVVQMLRAHARAQAHAQIDRPAHRQGGASRSRHVCCRLLLVLLLHHHSAGMSRLGHHLGGH